MPYHTPSYFVGHNRRLFCVSHTLPFRSALRYVMAELVQLALRSVHKPFCILA